METLDNVNITDATITNSRRDIIVHIMPTEPGGARTINHRFHTWIEDTYSMGYRMFTGAGPKKDLSLPVQTLFYTERGKPVGTTMYLMAQLLRHDAVLTDIFQTIFPVNTRSTSVQRLFEGTAWLTLERIFDIVYSSLGSFAAYSRSTELQTALSTTLALLIARVLEPLNIILPDKGYVSLTHADNLMPTMDRLFHGIMSDVLKESFETLRLGSLDVKLAANAMIALLLPIFTRAGVDLERLHVLLEEYGSALGLLRQYVTQDTALPDYMRGNADLAEMSMNLTLVRIALYEHPIVTVPAHRYEIAITNFRLALAGSRRFSVQRLDTLRSSIAHAPLYFEGTNEVRGVAISRSLGAPDRAQVTVFSNIGTSNHSVYGQVPVESVADKVDALFRTIYQPRATGGALVSHVASVANALLENDHSLIAIRIGGITDEEIHHYAAAMSLSHVLRLDDDETTWTIGFMNSMPEYNWKSPGLSVGDSTLSVDPFDAILTSGNLENMASGTFPRRTQSITEDARHMGILTDYHAFSNGLATAKRIELVIPSLSGQRQVPVAAQVTMRQLIGYATQDLSLTTQPILTEMMASLFHVYHELYRLLPNSRYGESGKYAIAVALVQVCQQIAASAAGQALIQSIATQLIVMQPSGSPARAEMRNSLRNGDISFQLIIQAALFVLGSLHLITDDQVRDTLNIFATERMSVHMNNVVGFGTPKV